jgi:hypothetical protein
MKLYVYPAKNQSKQTQKEDEFACYKWAVEQSGIDSLNLPKVEVAPAGGMKGASKGKQAQAQQNQQAQATAAKTKDQMKQEFQKAFSVL